MSRRYADHAERLDSTALGPAVRDLVFLPDARLVGEPDLCFARIDAFFLHNFIHVGGEVF